MFADPSSGARVLGVDPGLSRCGVGVVDGPGQRAALVASDVIRTGADTALGDRLAAIHDALVAAVRTHRPTALAVERVFINAQARTGVGAIQVVGLVHLIGAAHDLAVCEYTPSQVKAAVTGVGDADKDQVAFMVQRILRLEALPTPADRADALAVALCHQYQPAPPSPSSTSRVGTATPGMSPRLAAAMADAGPGLAPVRPRGADARGQTGSGTAEGSP